MSTRAHVKADISNYILILYSGLSWGFVESGIKNKKGVGPELVDQGST